MDDSGSDNAFEYTVSEISAALKRTVEDTFGYIRVRGEISGFMQARSGHCYMSLKDEKAVLDGVMWRNTAGRLAFKPEDGLEVVCTGKLTTYAGRSKYQIVIDRMEPAGIGALLAQLEERRKRLAKEGLFDEERRKQIPYLPEIVGVVTSPTGAVIRDILHRLEDRFPRHVLIWPVLVQGEGAAAQVAGAIEGFNALEPDGAVPRPDVLIVARGGGSIEDLWAFNEEIVVRAAAASEIPLISAVGHETDTTLIDYAADRRAPTPTAAAEMAVPVRADLVTDVLDLERRLVASLGRLVEERRGRLVSLARGLPRLTELIGLPQQRFDAVAPRLDFALMAAVREQTGRYRHIAAGLRKRAVTDLVRDGRRHTDDFGRRLEQAGRRGMDDRRNTLAAAGKLLESFSYKGVLERGFAVVRDLSGRPLARAAETSSGLPVEIEFSDDRRGAVIDGAAREAPSAQGGKKRSRKQAVPPDEKQGSLL